MCARTVRIVLFVCLVIISRALTASAAGEPDLRIATSRPGATVELDRIIDDGKALISVLDAGNNPITGLGIADFTVTKSGRAGKIVSVQPLSESLDIPRHIVLVLDNSFSMSERNAVEPLLAGVKELLKIVRPIDDVQIVVFDDKKAMNIGGRNLHVQMFKSNQTAELQDFVSKAYSESVLTTKTVLFEAMLAGLDLIGKMPATDPRFMVVFSDGADLNSAYKRDVVSSVSRGLDKFSAYAIDYMPGQYTDKFLTQFATENRGQIWKATSETNLVPIFQSVASKMLYHYIVSYIFPPTGKLAVAPESLTIDELKVMNAAPELAIDSASLILKPAVASAYGFAAWKVSVNNAKGVVAELAGQGNPAPELNVPLPLKDLQAVAAGGDLTVTMELQDRKEQNLTLTAPTVKVNFIQTRAGLAVEPASLTIEEIRTIDASPMLAHVYFAPGSSEIPSKYVRFAGPAETAGFDEQKFRGTLEKYYQLLNIIGKRLVDRPESTITIVGCNADRGVEKGKKKLSAQRAQAVKEYLQAVWNIAPERMPVEARNLPAKPSTSSIKEGQAENMRVEIHSTDMAILAPIRSVYPSTRIDKPELKLRPDITAPHGITRWKITAANSAGTVATLAGEGAPAAEIVIPVGKANLEALAAAGDITVKMELQDRKGRSMALAPAPVKVNFIQTSQRLAMKQDLRVQEKYALILFDFDKDTIDARNQEIVNRIVTRIRELPNASVEVVGHTDIIGKAAYNVKLSQRRALSVYKLLADAYGEAAGERIRHLGVGPDNPLYDNLSPEARSFNRTVTITLEYMSAE